ncbi:hypothetical protein EIB71_00120 [Kaistella daneshvariae]|uniref:Leucine-rich repeat domain-containing protein n=1 Tax=Kaistella daneshvariae TaxID=2487074 RepID=A0ABM7C5D6_9FLAO|nr:hypothetical protein [Kaistella daneshvariae]AZI66179.1 hypothetical protein EIB71_00120 [Kaistella daneshvariae]
MVNDNQQTQEIELRTNIPTFVSQIQVDYEGEIIKTNNEEILLYGMLIGENENLTIDSNQGDQTKEYSNGDKILNGSFYDLEGNKKYFLRFYVKTNKKIYYGNIVNFESKKHNSPSEQIINLNSQQNVIDFGKNNYTYVFELNIRGDVEDLSPLSSIIKVGKSLNIEYTSKLKTLHGLENLQIIGTDVLPNGQLQIYNNSKLETLSGLDKLMFTGRLYVGFNPLVNNLQGLGKLEQAWHSTFLTVPSFDGLPLNFRTGEFESRGFQGTDLGNRTINCEAYDFALKDAPNITSLKGFIVGNYQNTTSFTIENCKKLKSLEGIVFPSKYDDISITNCENFESLKGLDNLTIVDVLSLNNLPKLENLKGLENVSQIERLYLSKVSITNFMGLNSVKTIDHLSVSFCNNLINFQGLPSLTKIGDDISYFEISSCQNLENFVGLEKVQHFTRFNIYSLPMLKNFDGIKQAKMPFISIRNCNFINSLQGLENVFGVSNLAIYENQNLQNFCAIKNIVGNLNSNSYYVKNNLNNPTQQEIINNCP